MGQETAELRGRPPQAGPGSVPSPAQGCPLTTPVQAAWPFPGCDLGLACQCYSEVTTLGSPESLMPLLPRHTGALKRSSQLGAALPAPLSLRGSELRAGGGWGCLRAVSFWGPLTVSWAVLGTDGSGVPSAGHDRRGDHSPAPLLPRAPPWLPGTWSHRVLAPQPGI